MTHTSGKSQHWKDRRDKRAAARSLMDECPTCAIEFGTGTKVAKGETCHNCDWENK